MNILEELERNPFVLAPMAGITNAAFRSFMRKMGCGAVVTELVSATGLKFNSDRTRQLMTFGPNQHPIGIQIFGESLEDLNFATKEVEKSGADFVDLNFGCPVPKVVKKGAGAALLKDLVKVKDVFRAVKSATNLPVTVKIRTGWDASSRNAIELAQVAYDEGLSWVAIHGRTRAQAYTGLADWEYIGEVAQKSQIPILGNGDIHTAEQAVSRLKDFGVAGVMIGRGCLKNPWIFSEAMQLYSRQQRIVSRNFKVLFSDLDSELCRYHDERIQVLQIKKLSAWYSAGYPESSHFRKEVFRIKEKQELLRQTTKYFGGLSDQKPRDTSDQPFLMGGHG